MNVTGSVALIPNNKLATQGLKLVGAGMMLGLMATFLLTQVAHHPVDSDGSEQKCESGEQA